MNIEVPGRNVKQVMQRSDPFRSNNAEKLKGFVCIDEESRTDGVIYYILGSISPLPFLNYYSYHN